VSLFETILGMHGSNRPASTDERHGGVLDPAALAALLDAVGTLLSKYVVFRSTAQRTAVVLWIAHAHALKAFEVTPYLNVRSAEKRSGKTRLLETLAELVPRPWLTVQPTEAVLFRKIAKEAPTVLLDEVDTIFKGPSTDQTEGLRAVLNSGYRRGATVDRCAGRDKEKLLAFPGVLRQSPRGDRHVARHGERSMHPDRPPAAEARRRGPPLPAAGGTAGG
jgi:hypothetical protein